MGTKPLCSILKNREVIFAGGALTYLYLYQYMQANLIILLLLTVIPVSLCYLTMPGQSVS